MADDQNPYNFGWHLPPIQKSLARIKRTPSEAANYPSDITTPGQAQDIATKYANPDAVYSEDTGGMVPNPNFLPVNGVVENPVNPLLTAGVAGATAGGAQPPGPPVNPHTGGPTAQDDWLAHGGSLHTFHNAQVSAGLRPAIDARTTPSPNEHMAMNDSIRAGWGWEPAAAPTTGSQGSALQVAGGSAGDPGRLQAAQQARITAQQQKAMLNAQQRQRLADAQAQIAQPQPN